MILIKRKKDISIIFTRWVLGLKFCTEAQEEEDTEEEEEYVMKILEGSNFREHGQTNASQIPKPSWCIIKVGKKKKATLYVII